MSILDIKKIRKRYLYFSIFILIFSCIYELFSHGVISNYMVFSFLIPLIFGNVILKFIKKIPNELEINLYSASIITLTIASVIKGVLDIYGTTNSLIFMYLYISIPLLVISLVSYIFLNN